MDKNPSFITPQSWNVERKYNRKGISIKGKVGIENYYCLNLQVGGRKHRRVGTLAGALERARHGTHQAWGTHPPSVRLRPGRSSTPSGAGGTEGGSLLGCRRKRV